MKSSKPTLSIIIGIALLLLYTNGIAENVSIANVEYYSQGDFGTIMENDELKGYYLLYYEQGTGPSNRDFVIRIFDPQLKETGKQVFRKTKSNVMLGGVSNGKGVAVKFFNFRTDKVTIIFVDLKAKILNEYERTADKLESMNLSFERRKVIRTTFLHPVPGKGWLDYSIVKRKKQGFAITMFDNSGNKKWTLESDAETRTKWAAMHITSGTDMAVAMLKEQESGAGRPKTYEIMAYDLTTGEEVFRPSFSTEEETIEVLNVFFNKSKGTFEIVGEYKERTGPKKDRYGLFTSEFNNDGEQGETQRYPWAKEVGKFVDEENASWFGYKGHIVTQEMLFSSIDNSMLIVEQYQFVSGLAAEGTRPTVVRNFGIFTFNENKELVGADVIEKPHTRKSLGEFYRYMPAVELGQQLRKGSFFSHNYTQPIPGSNDFIISYLNEGKGLGKSRLPLIGFVKYHADNSEVEQTTLKTKIGNGYFWVKPAKEGHTLIGEFDFKANEVTLRLEKINFDQ